MWQNQPQTQFAARAQGVRFSVEAVLAVGRDSRNGARRKGRRSMMATEPGRIPVEIWEI
jgi:hypothetical protein